MAIKIWCCRRPNRAVLWSTVTRRCPLFKFRVFWWCSHIRNSEIVFGRLQLYWFSGRISKPDVGLTQNSNIWFDQMGPKVQQKKEEEGNGQPGWIRGSQFPWTSVASSHRFVIFSLLCLVICSCFPCPVSTYQPAYLNGKLLVCGNGIVCVLLFNRFVMYIYEVTSEERLLPFKGF